jgi:hypothetical protein
MSSQKRNLILDRVGVELPTKGPVKITYLVEATGIRPGLSTWTILYVTKKEMCPWAISKYFGDQVPTQMV